MEKGSAEETKQKTNNSKTDIGLEEECLFEDKEELSVLAEKNEVYVEQA